MKKLPINGLSIGLILVVVVAFIFPEAGAKGGIFRSEITSKLAVVLIFISQGLLLPSEEMKRDFMEWRLHLYVQSFNFIIIPSLVLCADLLFGHLIWDDLRLGFLYLAMLPTTISTAVIFSTQAGGNAAGAIFNVSLSNILGIFIVPVWTAWLLSTSTGRSIPVLPLLMKIALLLLIPLLIGQLLRIRLKSWADNKKTIFSRANMSCIFFNLYAAFCNSIMAGVWEKYGMKIVIVAIALSFLLLIVVNTIVLLSLEFMPFKHPSRMTALFCASQKTLAAGVPMANSIFNSLGTFAGAPVLGIVLLPLMCYHFLQLLLGGFMVGYFVKKNG